MRALHALLFASLPLAAACSGSSCSRSSSSNGAAPTPSGSPTSIAQTDGGAGAIAALAASASDFDSGLPGDEWIGAIGGHPIHATLVVTPTSIEGRWFYEAHGSASGLGIECKGKANPMKQCDGTETGDKNVTTGKLHFDLVGPSLVGSWEKPSGDGQLGVRLTPLVRSRGVDHVITARRVLQKPAPTQASGALFLPAVEGPAAARIASGLTLKALMGEDEKDLTGEGSEGVTGLDFFVLLDNDRFLTISINEETEGAYPDSHDATASFDWASGKRIGASAFLPEKKAAIVKLLNDRVHAAWRAQKSALSKKPASSADCGRDIADNFMDGDGPSFTAKQLDAIFLTKTGIDFSFGFDFPHAGRACEPQVDLGLPSTDAKPFLDPKGLLGNL